MNSTVRQEVESEMPIGVLMQHVKGAGDLPGELADTRVRGITLDSRQVRSGDLFIAIPGLESDGRRYADQALASGAIGIVYEKTGAPDECARLAKKGHAIAVPNLRSQLGSIAARFFHYPSESLEVVGVTGTNGKTTCAWLLTQALDQLGESCAMIGTIGEGFPGKLAGTGLTTADPISVQQSLRRWLDHGASSVCMEVSSHGLDQDRVEGVRFRVAVFTNLTRDHLDYHGDMESYSRAKQRLFRFPGLRSIVVNSDDPVGREILGFSGSLRTLSYGSNGADLVAEDVEVSVEGITFGWCWKGQNYPCRSRLIGEINVPNLLAVIGTLLVQDYPPEQIAAIIPGLSSPPGRMEPVEGTAGQPTVIVDYAHTPDSLERALDSLRALTGGRLIVVFGCGGDRDRGKRLSMGSVAALKADEIIITNDNPRGEEPSEIAAMAYAGVVAADPGKPCRVELDRSTAIRLAVSQANPGDVVLIAGKGHESTQTTGGQVVRFDDREVATAALGANP